MTNTINNVPRELLADLLCDDHDRRIMAERHLLAMLANAPSPAGVDGLEVVGYLTPHALEVDMQQADDEPLCRLSDAQAIIGGLRGEVYDEEKERAFFEAAFGALHLSGQYDSWIGRWKFTEYHVDSLWFGWISCAKSRALSAGKEGE